MALFDNLGQKVSVVSAKAIRKTKEFSDVTRLNLQIAEEENRQNNYYCQLGKHYYTQYATDCDESFKPLVSLIRDSEKKLIELKNRVQELKGVQRCEKCGAEVEKDALYCSCCGIALPHPESNEDNEDKVICTNCGASIRSGTRFCTVCGKPMQSPATEQIESPELTAKCPNCGASIDVDAQFCTECGTKIGEAELNVVAPDSESVSLSSMD